MHLNSHDGNRELYEIKQTLLKIFHFIVKKLKTDGLVTPCSLRVFKTAFVPKRISEMRKMRHQELMMGQK